METKIFSGFVFRIHVLFSIDYEIFTLFCLQANLYDPLFFCINEKLFSKIYINFKDLWMLNINFSFSCLPLNNRDKV